MEITTKASVDTKKMTQCAKIKSRLDLSVLSRTIVRAFSETRGLLKMVTVEKSSPLILFLSLLSALFYSAVPLS